MPYTRRIPHYGRVKDLLEYGEDKKHDGAKVEKITSINCNAETARLEFEDIAKKYKMKGNRVAYHLIQSFCPKDQITPKQANEIAVKMCKKIYKDFQVVIYTHIDKAHIHNHIAINAINMQGRKLEDRLANEKEGLYGFSNVSDEIAKEYGCYVMPKRHINLTKNKDYYQQYREQTWRGKIEEDIEQLKLNSNDIDDLLQKLIVLGYDVKRGKNISVKARGMKKFVRIHSIGEKYTEKNLRLYFQKNIDLPILKYNETNINKQIIEKADFSRIAIQKSFLATEGKIYSEYQKTKYKEIIRFYQLKEQLEFLEKYKINSYEDIENQIYNKRNEIRLKNIELKKYKTENIKELLEITEKAQEYIRLNKTYEYAIYYKSQDPNYILPTEAKIFLRLQKELMIKSIDEAKQLIERSRNVRIEIAEQKQEILELQRELNHLDTIKEEKLSKLYIHKIKFSGNHIQYNNSDNEKFCITIPYSSNERIFIEKIQMAFNEKFQYYTLFLVDDKEYQIYNEKNEIIKTLKGKQLEEYVKNKKHQIEKLYKNI